MEGKREGNNGMKIYKDSEEERIRGQK